MSTSAAPLVKAALVTGIEGRMAADTKVTVTYGPRPTSTTVDLICVGNVRTTVDIATIGPGRARQENHEIDVTLSSFAPGPDQQQAATERAYELLALIDAWLITSPNETLSIPGTIQARAWVREVRMTESDDPAVIAKGRGTTLEVLIQAITRI